MEQETTEPKVTNRKFKKVERGTQKFEHDLFDLLPAAAKCNISFEPDTPRIKLKTHRHKYHSTSDKTGKHNEFCSEAAGKHFHKIEVDFSKIVETPIKDEMGRTQIVKGPLVICGPALKVHTRKTRKGKSIKRVGPIKFEWDPEENKEPIVDDHTHDCVYMGTETMILGRRNKLRDEERKKVAEAMDGPVSRQFQQSEKLRNNAAVGKRVADGSDELVPKE